MIFKDLKQAAVEDYYPALFFEQVLPHRLQTRLRSIAWLGVVITFVGVLATFTLSELSIFPLAAILLPKVYGLFFIALPFWLTILALQSFYYSFYFKTLPDRYNPRPVPLLSFELAHIVYQTKEDDVLIHFLESTEGMMIIRRAGISADIARGFIVTRDHIVQAADVAFPDAEYISLKDYVVALYDADKDFAQFLFSREIQKKDLVAIVDWIVERETSKKLKNRWWSRDSLGRVPGIGKNWSYGQLMYLEKYTRSLPEVPMTGLEVHSTYGSKELEELESILVKAKGANMFLVSNDKEMLLQIIARLAFMIDEGTAYPELEHKRVMLFDTDLLTASSKNKSEFETKLLQIVNDTDEAGNVVLVIADFPSFISSAEALGSDITSLLDSYFTSPSLHIIGLSNVESFHSKIERNAALMLRFEKIIIESIDELNTVRVLQNESIPLERQFGLYFTYPALVAIAEGAVRYFPDAILPDSAVDLLVELAPKIAATGKEDILKSDVLDLVQVKTGIPVGEIKADERDKLINLEKFLHQRIIGQNEAVAAISEAVRRARSGINNPDRPLASFLFLGPTGVGKTETTKALAEVFFGAEAKIERLDMSEYSGIDALEKLIGSFESNRAGVLSTMLREHPYGVLLLDEFEKTTPEVMNLFLQVLDEGFFSDMSGKKINARNLLIIATSNAGSDLIWEAIKQGEDLSHSKELIVDSIIKTRIFKPELINRFDGVIVFHPLASEHLQKIANLQLEKLKKRLAERGMNLVITPDLIQYVMKYGTDPKFGARPMNRAIQDKVEHIIADKLIKGELKPGSNIELLGRDLAN
ncbi:AAA family ATPase [Candidatus Parcubacteria bacterium]|nr:AAA family ATPase [Candidatus Parcubacteria bacterium]